MIQGEILTFPLTDLVQWLALTRRTGMLVIAQGSDKGHRLATGGASVQTPTPTRSGVRMSVELYFLTGALVGASSAGRATLTGAEQVREMLAAALQWRSGRFAFSRSPLPGWAQTSPLRHSVERLLQEIALQREARAAKGLSAQAEAAEAEDRFAVDSESFTLAESLRLHVVNQLLKEDLKIPAFPALAARVLELTSDESFSLRALADLVTRDQAIAAQVLRYANSALQGVGRDVYSLEQAVQRLGADEVINIVLAASMHAQRLKHFRFEGEYRQLWKHSLAAAFVARTVALKTGLKGSLAFMCGLLMDFGSTILYSLVQNLLERRLLPEGVQSQMIEEIVWDYHPRIGRVVSEQWQLPQPVAETMANHHCMAEHYFNHPYVAIAALADYLVSLGFSFPCAEVKEAILSLPPSLIVAHPAGQVLQLNAETAQSVLNALPRDLNQSQKLIVN
jgi:HD-like signal output (HDOD) protein